MDSRLKTLLNELSEYVELLEEEKKNAVPMGMIEESTFIDVIDARVHEIEKVIVRIQQMLLDDIKKKA